MKTCPNCKKKYDDNSEFCGLCGSRLTEIRANSLLNVDTCKRCGCTLNEKNPFCPECGTPVNGKENQLSEKNSKHLNNKLLIVLGIVLAVVAIVISSVTAPTRKMNKSLKSGSFTNVADTYFELVLDDKKKKADESIVDFIEKTTDKLNNDFSCELDSIKDSDVLDLACRFVIQNTGNIIFTYYDGEIEESDLFYLDSLAPGYGVFAFESRRIDDVLENLENMLESKEAYYESMLLLSEADSPNDYLQAAERLTDVSQQDKLYSEALSKTDESFTSYMNSLSELADDYIENDDYGAAIRLLEEADENTKNDKISADVSSKLNEIKNTCAAKYAAKAEEEFKAGDINAAIGNMEAAFAISQDSNYETKLKNYQLYLPYPLYEKENCLKITTDEDFWGNLGFNEEYKSNDNKEMSHAIKWYNSNEVTTASCKAIYNLNGNYDVVKGVFFLPDYEKNTNLKGYFQAYGDGKLIYTSPKMTGGVLPKNVEFKVSGVKTLTIAFFGEGTGGFLGGGPDFGISNLVAQKNLPE